MTITPQVRMLLQAAAVIILVAVALQGLKSARPGTDLRDFGSFLASGEAAGKGLNPYGIYPLTSHVVLPGFESWNPNLNPPTSLPLFHLLSCLDSPCCFPHTP